MTYLGNFATAISLNIGQRVKNPSSGPITLSDDAVTIAEILYNPKEGERRLIASNMLSMQSYLNILKTDILSMLEESGDRAIVLDEHIELLKSYYTTTSERILLLSEQSRDLQAILSTSAQTVE